MTKRIVVSIAIVGSVLLLVQWAVGRPLWLDEEFLAINLRERGIRDFVEPLWLGQTAALGWLTLVRSSLLVFGAGERALRFVPVLFGIAAISTSAWIGRRWLRTPGPIVLVLLCAFSQWLTFYFIELKPYSADVFFALLVPALAAWALEGPSVEIATRRAVAFWIAASIGQLFAYGAVFVAPGCAVVLVATVAKRHGWRTAARVSRGGFMWLAVFALNYLAVLRHASSSAFFYRFWSFAFPPADTGVSGMIRWFGAQLASFAVKPGSVTYGALLWIAAIAGFAAAAASRTPVGWAFASAPVSACILSALRLVPLYERLTLWMVPSLYAGVALLAGAGSRKGMRSLLGAASMALALFICADVVMHGLVDASRRARARDENRNLDDRGAVRWLVAQQRPGDVWMTTHYGVPAIWWYAGIDRRILEVSFRDEGAECKRDDLAKAIAGSPRVLLYLGFRFDDVPATFDDLLVEQLSRLGVVTTYRRFQDAGHALIVDPQHGPAAPTSLSKLAARGTEIARPVPRCLAVRLPLVTTYVQ